MSDKVFTISQLNSYVKKLLEADDTLTRVYVKGELSNYVVYSSGHHYFSMKDASGRLKCVMFKGSASKLRFKPEDGMSVVAFGRVEVYQRDGVYQLIVNEITPDGVGDLYVAFEQLKEKLQKEGLFDDLYKKTLPRFPKKIAVITSADGVAVQDIIRVLGSRWPMTEVILIPVRVQGVEAPPEIVAALKQANTEGVADLIITGRGGGSIEDLWAFNDERVARAVFASEIPVISAVGHEPDYTITDFVADVRAATPSNAAEIAVPDKLDVISRLKTADMRLQQAVTRDLKQRRQRLNDISNRRVLQSPKYYIEDRRIQIDRSAERLISSMQRQVQNKRERYARLAASMDAMSPLKVLGRGYAIAQRDDGVIVKTTADVQPGDKIKVKLQKDEINCVVE